MAEFVDSRSTVGDDGDPDCDLEADDGVYDSHGSEEEAHRAVRRLVAFEP